MTHWKVELLGEAYDLEELPYFFSSGEICCLAEGEIFFLVAQAFEGQEGPSQVHAMAESLIDDITGAMATHIGRYPRPRAGPVHERGADGQTKKHYSLNAERATVYSRSRLGPAPVGPTYPQLFIRAGQRSRHLRHAMLIWADPNRTWPRLYRILEEVQQHLGTDPYRHSLCSKSEQKRFERTANSAEVAGADARHALGRNAPPPNPMTLEEAIHLVGSVLKGAVSLESQRGAAYACALNDLALG